MNLTEKRRLPIFTGQCEAHSLAQALGLIEKPRPLVHDIVKEIALFSQVDITEIIIFKVVSGVFYSKLKFQQGEKMHEVEARTSDAIALAYLLNLPIYTYESILSNYGVTFNFEEEEELDEGIGTPTEGSGQKNLQDEWSGYSKEQLHQMLEQAILEEDFEKASKLRDAINSKE